MFQISKAAFVGVFATCVAACGTEPVAQEFNVEPGEAATVVEAKVVATVKTIDGAQVRFLDESGGGEPSIGIEITNSLKTPITDSLLAQGPTALELYQAIAPKGQAPSALVQEHAHASDRAPRQLVAAALDGESSGFYDCANTVAWKASFQAWSPVLDGEYTATSESGATTGYVGYAPRFYFDVCRPYDLAAGLVPYYTGVERRSSSSASWVKINSNSDALDYQERRWRYYHSSLTCSSFQYRLHVVGTGPNRYHRAARWADEWSCGVTTAQ